MRATPFVRSTASFFTYTLNSGNALYVPLTCRCNARTLPQLRGPGFLLPAPVVAALCRVRDAELGTSQWMGWCNYLDTQDGSFQLPPPAPSTLPESASSSTASTALDEGGHLTPQKQPLVQDLFQEVRQHFLVNVSQRNQQGKSSKTESIVFSGEGEPTLRLEDLLELATMIRDDEAIRMPYDSEDGSSPSLRLTTNGLIDPPRSSSVGSKPPATQRLVDAGISHVSVALMTHDADLYDSLVQPTTTVLVNNDDNIMRAHDRACRFIEDAVQVEGLDVETTAVERADVDKAKTEALSASLGVTTPVRWRPYFP